jgi:hypothetical protein
MSASSSRRARLFDQARTVSIPRERVQQRVAQLAWPLLEVAIIIAWALWVGRAYLDLDPSSWPAGREFPSAVQTHFIWNLLPQCGDCIFWNGFVRGGAPAFAELHGSFLHPLVIAGTLLFGVVNGSKVVLVASLAMAGIAQWWLAKAINLGRVPRLWSALLVVAGGHLAARMELGAFGVVLSLAACSLVLAAAVDLALNRRRRGTLLLALTLALAIVAGQGYMQIGLALGTGPALLFLLLDDERIGPVWKQFAVAGGLAILLAAYFLIPMLHFYPQLYKEVDPTFASAQPLAYAPLNLVIDDLEFYRSEALQKLPYPHLNANFIGWLPLLLLLPAMRFVPDSRWRELAFLCSAIVFTYLASSATTLKMLVLVAPTFAAGIRHPAQIATLAVPPLLVLSAWGLHHLLRRQELWPDIILSRSRKSGAARVLSINFSWLVIVPLLLWSLFSVYRFSQHWLYQIPQDDNLTKVAEYVKTENTQWVGLPFGEHHWMIPALEAGLKVNSGIRTWNWADRTLPSALIEVAALPEEQAPADAETVNGLTVLTFPGNQYAYVQAGADKFPCAATANGGHIDVRCNTSEDGTLIVQENAWRGWRVTRNGRPVPLLDGPWLSAPAPAGEHTFQFRYQPWDVMLGLTLTVVGLGLTLYLWFNPAALHRGWFSMEPESRPAGDN